MYSQTAQVHWFTSFSAADRFRPDWDRWTRNAPQLSWTWLSNWWNQLAASGPETRHAKLALAVVVGEQNECLGIAPWYVSRQLSGRTLRYLGDGKAATDYVRPLGEPHSESVVASALARSLGSTEFERGYGRLDLMIAEGHETCENLLISLDNRLIQLGWTCQASPIESAWRVPLPGDWSKLVKQFSASQRRKVNKAFRLRQQQAVVPHWITTTAGLQKCWPDFVRLHQRRRHELGQGGCFSQPGFELFLKQAVVELLEQQRARLVVVEHDGRAIGMALFLLSDDTVFMYQSGIDPDHRQLEPGHLVNAFSLEWANAAGFKFFDFMRGDEPYKQDWGGQQVVLMRSRLVAPRWTSRFKNTAWLASRGIKQWSQRWLVRPVSGVVSHD